MSQPLDYKELLKKYMRHVRDCEGVDFTYGLDEEDGFTPEDIYLLQDMSEEITRA